MIINHFTEADDSRWAGHKELSQSDHLDFKEDTSSDIYILEGSIFEGSLEHTKGTFLVRTHKDILVAGDQGASLFIYQEKRDSKNAEITLRPSDLVWEKGGTSGMKVSRIFDVPHRLSLVMWEPGTIMPLHSHLFGEEIYVLDGELRDQDGKYPKGTWQRLSPGVFHAPFSEVKTLILLRNGHLVNDFDPFLGI